RVGVQRLRPAQHRRQRLNRNPDNVVVWLLRGQRASGRLRMESKDGRTRILAFETPGHHFVPDFPCGAILRDLLEEIIMCVEEKGKTRRKIVDVEAGAA